MLKCKFTLSIITTQWEFEAYADMCLELCRSCIDKV